MSRRLGATAQAASGGAALPDLSQLPDQVREVFETAFANATGHIFLLATPVAALAFLAILMIREVPLRTTIEREDELEERPVAGEPLPAERG